MRTDVKLSTQFLAAQNAHQVGLLVTVTGDTPLRRPPLNLSLVLDRSGSMGGPPLDTAKEAASQFVRGLAPQDRVSIVTYDDKIATPWGPGAGGDPSVDQAIAGIQAGGSTNLSGGWLEGRRHVAAAKVEGVNRVLLFTDGLANNGIVDPVQLRDLAGGARGDGVSTTCIGFGVGFNEDLLRSMSDAGGGQFWYVESLERLAPMLQGEIAGLIALAAQNLTLKVLGRHPHLAGVTVVQGIPFERDAEGNWVIRLGDLLATRPVELGLRLHIEEVSQLGNALIADIEITADVITAEGIQHRLVRLPVTADLDGVGKSEPVVEVAFTRFEAAQARAEAIAKADEGDMDGAATVLHNAAQSLRGLAEPTASDLERAEDLEQEALRMKEERYDVHLDRKYLMMRNVAERQGRMDKVNLSRRTSEDEAKRAPPRPKQ